MQRKDYQYPFRIDAASGQAARTPYDQHVAQMIRQILLTSPGERANLPDFGCGVRRMLFAPNTDALAATTEILVRDSLTRWLSDQITVEAVSVSRPDDAPERLDINIEYTLLETLSRQQTEVRLI